jgi:hypothetical protein
MPVSCSMNVWRAHTYTHSFIHSFIHTYNRTYTHTHIHTYIHTYIHTHTHIHTCTHIHAHTVITTHHNNQLIKPHPGGIPIVFVVPAAMGWSPNGTSLFTMARLIMSVVISISLWCVSISNCLVWFVCVCERERESEREREQR